MKTRGGSRKGAGRPRLDPHGFRRYKRSFMVTEPEYEQLRKALAALRAKPVENVCEDGEHDGS